ncbi:molybdopterin-guanine dinucleotide biosynthesis protein B [Jannaschia sp. LMIT008]|uniref:molybdopterin-guanine dinucleotide biosynthesis protein B n=1 Tax=Jannaschia maritima TaxID=3032585 RepID=UPI0028114082|nr:molybdopterin-guanine dinucleotide biosynthesis protein B [Jannaschia sp. LMIT008]
MRVWGIVGRKDAGKTTLTERLTAELTARGLRVSTAKRTHHALDLDRPGTDTHRHRRAGAGQVVLASDARLALLEETARPLTLTEVLARLAPCDIVLAEGWKRGTHPRVEVWRGAGDPLARTDPTIAALATDHPAPDVACPLLDLDDMAAVADFVLR